MFPVGGVRVGLLGSERFELALDGLPRCLRVLAHGAVRLRFLRGWWSVCKHAND